MPSDAMFKLEAVSFANRSHSQRSCKANREKGDGRKIKLPTTEEERQLEEQGCHVSLHGREKKCLFEGQAKGA